MNPNRSQKPRRLIRGKGGCGTTALSWKRLARPVRARLSHELARGNRRTAQSVLRGQYLRLGS